MAPPYTSRGSGVGAKAMSGAETRKEPLGTMTLMGLPPTHLGPRLQNTALDTAKGQRRGAQGVSPQCPERRATSPAGIDEMNAEGRVARFHVTWSRVT